MRILTFLLLTFQLGATVKFVNKNAAGSNNGTTWANGWTSLSSIGWAGLAAGDIVCVAGATYTTGITTGKSGTSGNPITIRRATAADASCGSTTTGWSGAFDAQVVLSANNTFVVQNDWVTIDGAVTSGFLLTLSVGGDTLLGVNAATTGVIIRYVEFSGPCAPAGCNQSSDSRAISLNIFSGGNFLAQTNWIIQYTNMHGFCTPLISYNAPGLIVEHSRFADAIDNTPGNPDCHPNVYEDGGGSGQTFRYNEITNWQVECIMTCPNGACTTDIAIYGNIWHDPYPGSTPRVIEAQGNANGPYLFYNNTLVNLYNICASTANGGSYASGTIARNNLYYGNNFANCGLPDNDYDYSDQSLAGETHGQGNAANPFVSYAGKNFNLATNTNAGLTLLSPYNIDVLGNTRGSGSAWSRGAYQFEASGSGGSTRGGSGTTGGSAVGKIR